MTYAKLNSDNQLDYYDNRSIEFEDNRYFNPTVETLTKAGYLPVPTTRTDAPVLSWSIVDGALVPTYGEPYPPKPRTFSKLKLVAALMQANLWAQVKAWIEASGLYDLYLAAQVVSEDNEYFTQGLAQLQSELGLTDEQVEEILSQCVAE